jgi:gas vesicle protein
MKEKNTNRKSAILMPVLIGSTLGAGVALLLAPKTGKEIRKDLKRFAANTRDRVAGVIGGGRDLFEEGREAVTETVKAGKETYDEGTKELEKVMHKKEPSLMSPKAEKEVKGNLKRIAANTKDKIVSAIDKGKAPYTEGRKVISKAMGAGQKEYIRKNVKHHHAA